MKSLQQGPKDERIPWSTVAEYTEQWTWPKGSLKVAHLFSEKAVRKHKKAACFMASASELLTLVPVFMCFFPAHRNLPSESCWQNRFDLACPSSRMVTPERSPRARPARSVDGINSKPSQRIPNRVRRGPLETETSLQHPLSLDVGC